MLLTGKEESSMVPAKTKILIVEDEPIVAMDLSIQLEQLGYEICGMEDNGHAAIAAARKHLPDLVLMDIVIKGDMDGIETAKHIGRELQIPVIFLTAFSDSQTLERAVQVAPHGYLTKPFQPKELRAVIQVALYKAMLEKSLRESELWFASTLRCVGDGVIATDPLGHVRFMNQAAEVMTGWSLERAREQPIDAVFQLRATPTAELIPSVIKRVLTESRVLDLDHGMLLETRGGKRVPIDHTAAPIRDQDDRMLGAVVVFRDVSARVEAERLLLESEKRFRNTFDFAPIGMALISLSGRVLQVNAALCTLLEFSEEELLKNKDQQIARAKDVEAEHNSLLQLISGDAVAVQFEKRFLCKSGREIWTHVGVSLLRETGVPGCYLYQLHDLTEQRARQYQLAQLAHFDTLTGLANRARLRVDVEQTLLQAQRNNSLFAVVFIDLDHFKEINDTLGHEGGDILLKIVADRLKQTVRASDCIARLGGDEFVLLLPEVNSVEDVGVALDKIRSVLLQPIDINGHEAQIGISFGVSMYPDDGHEATELFRCADSALYHAKAEGRNNVQFYREELTVRMEHRLSVTNALRHALERNELVLHYQPIMALSSPFHVAGVEVLLRWNHPECGLILPAEFLSVAESTGLIVPIGAWVIAEACHEAAQWLRGGNPLVVSVNVSVRQFAAADFVALVAYALEVANLPGTLLCIEITEQFLMQDTERHLAIVGELKLLGVKIAIDDFGVGYSSLSHLRRFAPDSLKIDKSFIDKIAQQGDDQVIIKTVIAMARSLGMQVVAEGVETEQQCAFLIEEQCNFSQGFLFSKPLPLEAFRNFEFGSKHPLN